MQKYPSISFIRPFGRRYTLTGNRTGNRSSAQRFSLRSNLLRESFDIRKPHYRQPVLPVPPMEDEWDFPTSISDGLLHPEIRVPSLHPLYL